MRLRIFIMLFLLFVLALTYVGLACMARRRAGGTGIVPVLDDDEVDRMMDTPSAETLVAAAAKVKALHSVMGRPQPGDWILSHPEDGQTFRQFLACDPVTARGKRNIIYIQPLGGFTRAQRKIVGLTAQFMGLYFNLKVKVLDDLPIDLIPESERRIGPLGLEQIKTGYVLYEVLRPRLPADAAAYIAFTGSDLWPGPGWNFVFGQASLRDRVAVWSICRFGDPDSGEKAFGKTLLRTLKTGTHETGHMFSILHCTAYECNMCGSNNMAESDRRPLWLCPECMPKVCWATETLPEGRYRKLARFCSDNSLKTEADFYLRSLKALEGGK